ncbi:MAG: hypothetical protein M2R45_05143 [Verrucomicrobia subdivision 3 bacterium]|nr:hypothetical protein [Limisphaerales bacterium]MCS1417205.1 hypothetical protein [Limisphaerales bacterium]
MESPLPFLHRCASCQQAAAAFASGLTKLRRQGVPGGEEGKLLQGTTSPSSREAFKISTASWRPSPLARNPGEIVNFGEETFVL